MSTSSISTSASVSAITITTITSILSDDNIINTRIENATKGLPYCFNYLSNKVLPGSRGEENTLTICDYISSMKSEINPSDHYKNDVIILLCNLSIFFKNTKAFKEITRVLIHCINGLAHTTYTECI
jgi:hypothetical protein